jgi:hypothetical protein
MNNEQQAMLAEIEQRDRLTRKTEELHEHGPLSEP